MVYVGKYGSTYSLYHPKENNQHVWHTHIRPKLTVYGSEVLGSNLDHIEALCMILSVQGGSDLKNISVHQTDCPLYLSSDFESVISK